MLGGMALIVAGIAVINQRAAEAPAETISP
jgi:hypothetical protein